MSEEISAIAPYVIQVLTRSGFFDLLDHRLSVAKCARDFAISKALLEQIGFPAEDQSDIFAVLEFRGAACDCEILYNVVLESRLKAEYWKTHPAMRGAKFAHGQANTG